MEDMTHNARDRLAGQDVIEALLGRMLTDGAFRQQFFVEPESACAEYGFDVTAAEVAPLLRFDSRAISDFAKRLDPRIVRAALGAPLRRAAEPPAAQPGTSQRRR